MRLRICSIVFFASLLISGFAVVLNTQSSTRVHTVCGNTRGSLSTLSAQAQVSINVALQSTADSWPMFHDDLMHTGYSTSLAPDTNQTLWTHLVGGHSSPAVADGRVYLGSNWLHTEIVALNAKTGGLVWSYPTGVPDDSSPAVSDGVVFVGSDNANVYALNATTGALIWSYTTFGAVKSSPAVAAHAVYIGSNDGNVYALDAATGAKIWNYTTGSCVLSSPAIAGGIVYAGSMDSNVYALNATTGALIWSYKTGDVVVTSPAIVDDVIYIGSQDRNVYALNSTAGTLIWNHQISGPLLDSSPAVADGVLYVGSDDRNIYALNATTGVSIWTYTTGGAVFSSPAVAGNILYVGSEDGNLYAFNGTTGTLVWIFTTAGAVTSSPAVADGVVYVDTNDNTLYAFGVPTFPRPSAEWNQTYGGADRDEAYSVVQTSDGGYALAGTTLSFAPDAFETYLVKTDGLGNMQWSKDYGGPDEYFAESIVRTGDGGYALGGWIRYTATANQDFYLVKTDSTGNIQWSRNYGGDLIDRAYSTVQTSDGGYALVGYTYSFDAAASDFYLVKTDSAGNMQWNKTYGGKSFDYPYSVVQTSDGGYAIAGSGFANLVKTDSAGNLQWNRTYGASFNSLVQTSDGGYALAGDEYFPDSRNSYVYLVKTDGAGNVQWNKTYGPEGGGSARSVIQTRDGGYAMAGSAFGLEDAYLVKTDGSGNMQWNSTYGGVYNDWINSIVQTTDGGYVMAGGTTSYGAGSTDFWLVRIGADVISEFPTLAVLITLMTGVTTILVAAKTKRVRRASSCVASLVKGE